MVFSDGMEVRPSLENRQAWPESPSSLPSVGLCFSLVFLVRSGTTRDGGGEPMCSRAIVFTASTAVNRFFLFFFAIALFYRQV